LLDGQNALLGTGVVWLGPVEDLDAPGELQRVARIAPCSGPPAPALLARVAHLLAPEGRVVLVYACRRGSSLLLPVELQVVDGDPTVLPGLPDFDVTRHDSATVGALHIDGSPLAVLVCGRRA
jgi:hypothetical protein